MIQMRRKHPVSVVYIDGKLVVMYYGQDDPRNKGDVALTAYRKVDEIGSETFGRLAILDAPVQKITAKHNGEEFEVEVVTTLKFYRKSSEQTEIVQLQRK